MRTYPRKPRTAFLDWCRTHEEVFIDHAAEIGISAAEADAFKAAAALGETRLLELQAAREAARVATQRVRAAFDSLEKHAGNVVRTIRAFAERSADPRGVCAVAQISPRASRSPQPPPAQPGGLTVTLDPSMGSVTLHWKASNPAGTTGTAYLIRRRLPDQDEFAFVGVSGKKRFVDSELPAGSGSVQYTVQGQRGDLAGPVSPIFTVNFGKRPDGRRTATVSSASVPTLSCRTDGVSMCAL